MRWDPQHLIAQIESEYSSSEWAVEGEPLAKLFEKLATSWTNDLHSPRFLNKGGNGLAIAFERTDDRIGVVLKVARPIPTSAIDLDQALEREARMIGRLRHPNVVRLVDRDFTTIDSRRFSWYTTEVLDHPLDSDKYLTERNEPNGEYIVSDDRLDSVLETIVSDVLDGLTYIHSLKILHSDIKPQNIFVEQSGHAVLGDFGFALDLSRIAETDSPVEILGTYDYMHPELLATLREYVDDKRRALATVRKRQKNLVWDLYSLGITVNELVSIADQRTPQFANSPTRQYLRLIGARLLDGRNDSATNRPLGLPHSAFEELKYRSAKEALEDIQRQSGATNIARLVPELLPEQPSTLPASVVGPAPSTKRTLALFDAPEVGRLADVFQLGLLRLVYPTATHFRREHSLGTFAACIRYIRSLDADRVSPIFRSIMRESDVNALLVASLIHDIGHYPLAHDLEEAESSIFSHERRTQALLEHPSVELRSAIEDPPPAGWGVSIERVRALLNAVPLSRGTIRDQLLHSVIDGPIDCDKVDYLIRDAMCMLLPYGSSIDYEKLISSLSVSIDSVGIHPSAQIISTDRGRIAAESVAFARYAMYGAAYWQHTHRAAKAMLNRLVWQRLDREAQVSGRNYRESLRQKLDALVDTGEDAQLSYFPPSIDLGQRLDSGSKRIIAWLVNGGESKSLKLAAKLANRDLYKRGFVFTSGGRDGINFRSLSRVFALSPNWRRKLKLSELVEASILELVRAQDFNNLHASSAELEQFTKLVSDDVDEVICLVDYPPTKSGSRGALASLQERPVGANEPPVKSELWEAINDRQQTGSAKLRIFIHPEYVSMVKIIITTDEMANIVNAAIAQVSEQEA